MMMIMNYVLEKNGDDGDDDDDDVVVVLVVIVVKIIVISGEEGCVGGVDSSVVCGVVGAAMFVGRLW